MRTERGIKIRGAREHNLQGFDIELPRQRLIVITGVSGSGKSSLAFDTLFREGQRRFLELLPSFTRQFSGGLRRPRVAGIDGLGPAVAVQQGIRNANPRSTVGTITEVWDLLRLLYARLGESPLHASLTRGLFSFNGEGACPHCRGLGVEDRLDPELIVADPKRSIREGALRVSTPTGYLMYSQVTLPVLDQVLRAHGGSIDLPWINLSKEVRRVVYHGSDRLVVPYGKHPLENRLRWTGITARPRQEGTYRGLLPVMEEILRGKRNNSILRFVRSQPCGACDGTRLRPEARAVRWRERAIPELAALTARELRTFFEGVTEAHPVLTPIRADLLARCTLMEELGVGYLSFDRSAPTLAPGEAQRLRLLTLALGELRGLVVVLDEPSAGLHSREVARLVGVLRRLRDRGQTVIVVDHDPTLALEADWLVDLGPGPGRDGGRLLWNGPPRELLRDGALDTPTRRWLLSHSRSATEVPPRVKPAGVLHVVAGLTRNNVTDASIALRLGRINLITGVSGAGKTSLLDATIARLRENGPFRRIVTVDAEPIGRTPRSNPATYSGAFDPLRDLFAATPEAKALGLGKGHFSFNTSGGRCERCEGAGVLEIGMRYLGTVELTCEPCGGRRFHPDVLSVKLNDLSIADLLEASIAEAADRFAGHAKLGRILRSMVELGLGYLPLGQPATTLSGGEAQRVKLATELARATSPALIALDEPTTGLHAADVAVLVGALDRLCAAGHTLLVVDHDLDLVRAADAITELGPGSGPDGGRIVAAGSIEDLMRSTESATGAALRGDPIVGFLGSAAAGAPLTPRQAEAEGARSPTVSPEPPLELRGVTTHNLRQIDVAIPAGAFSVVTGPSGSGKSSLVFDTLLAESQARFADLVSPWARRFLPQGGGAEFVEARGLSAAVAVPAHAGRRNPRSTVGTATGVDELLRLLFARGGTRSCPGCDQTTDGDRCDCGTALEPQWAADFSPHSERGACPACRGLGFMQVCEADRLVNDPDRPLDGGAMAGTRYGTYLGEPDGQHMAVLRAAAEATELGVSGPWSGLSPAARRLAMEGAGPREFDVAWAYRRGQRSGVHHLRSTWLGLARLVEIEYERTHADERGEELEALLVDRPCGVCNGERLRDAARQVSYEGLRAPEAAVREVDRLLDWLAEIERETAESEHPSRAAVTTRPIRDSLRGRLQALRDAGLGYLSPAREIFSLSGGEAQRVRLAAALVGGLTGVTFLLDEPTQGLHPRDTRRLIGVLQRLAREGNTVVVVEHDAELIAAADHVIEIGPGAGPDGGRVVTSGSPARLQQDGSCYTARLLASAGRNRSRDPRPFRPGITIRGAYRHNLRGIDVTFPRGTLTVIAGLSGSGKSTLALEVLAPSLRALARGGAPIGCRGIECHVVIKEILSSDQDVLPVGGGSTVASLLGLAESIRRHFAATPEAKVRGLTAKAFSTASPGGRCEACAGRGVIEVAMDFLPDVLVGCERCGGRRFSEEVLGCRIDGRSIHDLLELPLGDALEWFAGDALAEAPLRALLEIGLGYLHLGQEGSTLSSGERQRLRLAQVLSRADGGPVAILLDEPTRGLGFEDVDRLLAALHASAGAGHVIVVVEHHPEVVASADWLIELGPEGGAAGGRVVWEGPPRHA